MKVCKKACPSCPFEGSRPLRLAPIRYQQITEYVIKGTNHLCHSDLSNQTICRGGRNLFLRVATYKGMIEKPTDEALEQAIASHKLKS